MIFSKKKTDYFDRYCDMVHDEYKLLKQCLYSILDKKLKASKHNKRSHAD